MMAVRFSSLKAFSVSDKSFARFDNASLLMGFSIRHNLYDSSAFLRRSPSLNGTVMSDTVVAFNFTSSARSWYVKPSSKLVRESSGEC